MLACNCLSELKIDSKKLEEQIIVAIDFKREVVYYFIVAPTKAIYRYNESTLYQKEVLKSTIDQQEDCVTDLDCVQIQKILDIYEQHEAWREYFKEKDKVEKEETSLEKDKSSQRNRKRERANLLESKRHMKTRMFIVFLYFCR